MSQSADSKRKDQNILRRTALRQRADMADEIRDRSSAIITSKTMRRSWFWRTSLIGCYLPSENEVNTWPIFSRAWKMKKRIFVPVVEEIGHMHFAEVTAESALRRNRYGLLEPVDGEIISPRDMQVVLSPLAAFDNERNRIGMGGGYYDRAFSFMKRHRVLTKPKLIGLAFDCQRVNEIAANPWDIRLYDIITEST